MTDRAAERKRIANYRMGAASAVASGFMCAMTHFPFAVFHLPLLSAMVIFLLGYRGSGKTTIGRRLADRLWIKFADTDELIVRAAGRSIADIFRDDGEARFREMEVEAVAQAVEMSSEKDHVIALGGGAVMTAAVRDLIMVPQARRIYLRCDPAVLLERIQGDSATAANRPNLSNLGGGLEEIQNLLAQREPVYRQVMTSELDVTHLDPDKACAYIARML